MKVVNFAVGGGRYRDNKNAKYFGKLFWFFWIKLGYHNQWPMEWILTPEFLFAPVLYIAFMWRGCLSASFSCRACVYWSISVLRPLNKWIFQANQLLQAPKPLGNAVSTNRKTNFSLYKKPLFLFAGFLRSSSIIQYLPTVSHNVYLCFNT